MTALVSTTVVNLRDLGGLPLSGGRTVRPGLVLRAGQLDRLDPAADPVVADLALATIVDFRSAAERHDHPDRVPAGVRHVVADALADTISEAAARGDAADRPAAAQLKHVLSDPQLAEEHLGGGRARAMFEDTYRALVSSASAVAAYRTFLTELAAPDAGPLLFHCTAGKDRTGWAATIVLILLGADAETVEAEYLAVDEAVREAFVPLIDGFVAKGGDPAIAQAVIGVVPEYLKAALAEVDEKYGSMEAYVRDGLGIPDEAVARLRARLTTG
ncbi:tyrosine-protein phosphatase [Streptomyces candidus]|uniref:Protein-tyrosine phosphatase n=1 Tax=Streptomyces candidus TaxID=67283 RepID=A0A7X0LLZ5_9ACTN|nr:tyrosine-protein phosphatase [Streptomyces candidus]MBB6433858.1 protein-tyrosine phosphatase [Streptomyces candidus]GHH34282.1 phosphatase [Streptomyces candidus]